MPFAPAVLDELADDWVTGLGSPPAQRPVHDHQRAGRPDFAEKLPAGVHVDGSLRPQLVDAERTPSFHKVLTSFNRLTGLPGIINTSFNLHGSPSCAPQRRRCAPSPRPAWTRWPSARTL
ncbi:MAG: hypothetical protein H6741_33950 [Alphaproteobacteria bacterium]|nr:hypothetical protein [Alphaproteobacteria bacterium]